jgi:hypothetical protein
MPGVKGIKKDGVAMLRVTAWNGIVVLFNYR